MRLRRARFAQRNGGKPETTQSQQAAPADRGGKGVMTTLTIKQAEARVAAAQKRVLAANLDSNAAAHMRQAESPAYGGQGAVCADKAARIKANADKLRAEADLIEARAATEVSDA